MRRTLKAEWVIDSYITYLLVGEVPQIYMVRDCNWFPTVGNGVYWMKYIDSLYELYRNGEPTSFIQCYSRFVEE